MKLVAIACFFAAGLGIALAAAEDPKREDPPEDKSLVIGKQKSKVENGSAFDKGIVELGKRKRLAIPENAEVIHKGDGTNVEVFMKKTMNFGGHPPRPMSIRVARKYTGCATKDEDGLLQLATYGEWSTKEGGGRIRLVLVVPEKIEVVRQKALSGPKSIAHPPPGQPPPKPATDEEKESYWYSHRAHGHGVEGGRGRTRLRSQSCGRRRGPGRGRQSGRGSRRTRQTRQAPDHARQGRRLYYCRAPGSRTWPLSSKTGGKCPTSTSRSHDSNSAEKR